MPAVSHRSIHSVLDKCVLRVEIKSNSCNWENALEYHRQVILADREVYDVKDLWDGQMG